MRVLWLVLAAACAPVDPVVERLESEGERPWSVPEDAIEIAPDVFHLGFTEDLDGTPLEGIAYVDRVDTEDHDDEALAARTLSATTCYALTGGGGGAKLGNEPWSINPKNRSGISASVLTTSIAKSMALWETAAGTDIFGNYVARSGAKVDLSGVDGQNNIVFGDAGGGGVVAVTYVWGVFTGSSRVIYEWDQVYDDRYTYTTINTTPKTAFDFRNVATHELGHAAGLDHPPSTCIEETMYAYVAKGETKKRSLWGGDKAGINVRY